MKVLASQISDQTNVGPDLTRQDYAVDMRFIERDVGRSSEWPVGIFAFRGNVEGVTRQGPDGIIIGRLILIDKQKMPPEVYSQFLVHQTDRQYMIDEYLDSEFYDAEGYKVMF